jgi:hypothetical protein
MGIAARIITKSVDSATRMRRALAKHQAFSFHFRFPGDESWMFDSYRQEALWGPALADLNEMESL